MICMNSIESKELTSESLFCSVFDVELVQSLQRDRIIGLIREVTSTFEAILDFQAFKYDSLLSKRQLLSAVWHAWNGFKNDQTISNLLSIEFLLYVSGQRQISKALEFFGLERTASKFSLIFFHTQTIENDSFTSKLKEQSLIKNVMPFELSDTIEKRKRLEHIFDFKIDEGKKAPLTKDSFLTLENYILTSIANVVFETKLSKKDE